MTLRSDWLVHNQEETGGRVRPRMFCFPFAGGGASIYRNWGRALGSAVDLYAVQLPGREERIREPRYYSVKSLCDAMFEAGEDGGWFDAPCIIYGHSMGAKIAFETARRLEEQGRPPCSSLSPAAVPLPPRRPASSAHIRTGTSTTNSGTFPALPRLSCVIPTSCGSYGPYCAPTSPLMKVM